MGKYIIELRCWDGYTTVEMELNESQKEAIELLSTKTQEKSKCGGEPALYISESLADTNDSIQEMTDEELTNTFIFLPPGSIRERFQNMIDTLKPFKNNR